MLLTTLVQKKNAVLPGIIGVARLLSDKNAHMDKIQPGDIVVIDAIDLDRATAEKLLEKKVSAVINASPFISGQFPNLGPEVLALSGVTLLNNVGVSNARKLKDGMKIRIFEGIVFHGERELFEAEFLSEIEVAEKIVQAKTQISDHLEAFASNAIAFIRSESSLLIDGIGIPDVDQSLKNKNVVIVSDGTGYKEDLKNLKKFIKEYRPILIGVNCGANAIIKSGYSCDIVVTDPDSASDQALQTAKTVIIPADTTGKVKGLRRIQDLGIAATTFPGSGSAADLALILAEHHEAKLIVTVGQSASLHDFFDPHTARTNPSTLLTRLKMGHKLVDAKAVANLYQSQFKTLWVLLFFVIAMCVAGFVIAQTGQTKILADWFQVHMSWLILSIKNFVQNSTRW